MKNRSARLKADRAIFRRMVLSHFDFQEARHFLDELTRIPHDEDWTPKSAIRQALMTALLVSYSRPFLVSKDDGKTAIVLPGKLLRVLSKRQRKLHDKVLKLRKEQFAHTDAQAAALRVVWNLRSQGFAFPMPVSKVTRAGLTPEELRRFSAVLIKVSREMFVRYSALGESLLLD